MQIYRMSTTLSSCQQQVLTFILSCYRTGFLPSPIEVADQFGLSRTTAQRRFRVLVAKGYLKRHGKHPHYYWGLTSEFLNKEME